VSDEIEDLSPLRKPVQYTGKLNKMRDWVEPPRPGHEYPAFKVNRTASDNYDAQHLDWWQQQVELDKEGFCLLAEHFGLDQKSPDFWMNLALNLARNHVKGFRMSERPGRSLFWDEHQFCLLQLRVIALQKEGHTVEGSLAELKSAYRNTSRLDRRLEKARQTAASPGALYPTTFFEEIQGSPLDFIRALQNRLEHIIEATSTAESVWYDK
jgi:hypothetical protein